MLVLTRREGEAIVIDRDIRIVVLSNDRRGVRIGIVAPPDRTILREELLQEVVGANQRAAQAPTAAGWVTTLAPAPHQDAPAPIETGD
jgi:carbon storage regulator